MSCINGNPTFRLLDAFVGWNEANVDNDINKRLSGYEDPEGIRLSLIESDAVSPTAVLSYLLPSRLAKGCQSCEWFLVDKIKLLRRDCCSSEWLPVWSETCNPHILKNACAVAYKNHRLAVSDTGASRIWIWEREGEQLVAEIKCDDLSPDMLCDRSDIGNKTLIPGTLAFTPWGELLVVDSSTGASIIWRFGPAGEVRGKLIDSLPTEMIDRIAISDDCSIWLVTRNSDDVLKIWRATRDDYKFIKASIEELKKAFKPTGLKAVDENKGFCMEECGSDGLPVTSCFNWDGQVLSSAIEPTPEPLRYDKGQLLTKAIDSGIPRCRWHRLQVDADVPSGTSLQIAVATNEIKCLKDQSNSQGDPEEEQGWENFPAGFPHPEDWQNVPSGINDILIDQPAGRYLYLRMRLTGDGIATPVVRRIRLDFPRVTSLEYLPAVYRDDPPAEDFTERFLALFDATISDLDRAIERSPALLDPDGVPSEVLPWLGSFLAVGFDPEWDSALRRKIIHKLPELYRLRGTVAGLTEAIKLIFDVEPAIQELGLERNWGALAKTGANNSVRNGASLGVVRLFSKSRSRFRLNSSALGKSPLRSYGNPDHDPLLTHGFRFRVLVPPYRLTGLNARQRLEKLIASQKPAHTLAEIHVGGHGFVLGYTSAVGVDTLLVPLPKPILGKTGNIRLRRMSLLWHGKKGRHDNIQIGETAIVSIQTIIQ